MISKTELYHCWKKYKAMKDKKNLEVLLKAAHKKCMIKTRDARVDRCVDDGSKHWKVYFLSRYFYFAFSLLLSLS